MYFFVGWFSRAPRQKIHRRAALMQRMSGLHTHWMMGPAHFCFYFCTTDTKWYQRCHAKPHTPIQTCLNAALWKWLCSFSYRNLVFMQTSRVILFVHYKIVREVISPEHCAKSWASDNKQKKTNDVSGRPWNANVIDVWAFVVMLPHHSLAALPTAAEPTLFQAINLLTPCY